MKKVVFDIETTGLPPKNADYKINFMDYPHIVTLAFKIDECPSQYFIVNQEGRAIPPESIAIHGITDEMCQASPHTIVDVLMIFMSESKGATITIGHNIYFDSSIVKATMLKLIQEGKISQECYAELELILHKDIRVDTMKSTISYCALPGKFGNKWPKLTELHFKLFGEDFEAHNSQADVEATDRCYLKLKEIGILK